MPGGRRRRALIALGTVAAFIAVIFVGTLIHRGSVGLPFAGALVDQSGSGPGGETTEVFTVDQDWDLHWSYDCSSALGTQHPATGSCDFMVTVKELAYCQVSPENPGVVEHGPPSHGVVHYHTGGTFYFVVDAYGSWTVAVTGSGRASGVGPAPQCMEG